MIFYLANSKIYRYLALSSINSFTLTVLSYLNVLMSIVEELKNHLPGSWWVEMMDWWWKENMHFSHYCSQFGFFKFQASHFGFELPAAFYFSVNSLGWLLTFCFFFSSCLLSAFLSSSFLSLFLIALSEGWLLAFCLLMPLTGVFFFSGYAIGSFCVPCPTF